jgi:hypothetical protein
MANEEHKVLPVGFTGPAATECPPWCAASHVRDMGAHFGPIRRGSGPAEVRAALSPTWDAPRILIFDHEVDGAWAFMEVEAATELAGVLSREAPALAEAIRRAVADQATTGEPQP